MSIAVSISSVKGKNQVFPKGNYQAGAQLGGAFCTLFFGLLSGACVGKLMKTVLPNKSKPFRDGEFLNYLLGLYVRTVPSNIYTYNLYFFMYSFFLSFFSQTQLQTHGGRLLKKKFKSGFLTHPNLVRWCSLVLLPLPPPSLCHKYIKQKN